jgi:hypothetical protein
VQKLPRGSEPQPRVRSGVQQRPRESALSSPGSGKRLFALEATPERLRRMREDACRGDGATGPNPSKDVRLSRWWSFWRPGVDFGTTTPSAKVTPVMVAGLTLRCWKGDRTSFGMLQVLSSPRSLLRDGLQVATSRLT